MLTIDDKSLLMEFERSEAETPLPSKVIDDDRTIYGSRRLGLPKDQLWGQPVLCDFGEARIGRVHHGVVQPELYRAPEVLFDMEWGPSIDVWAVATLIWDLFGNRHLFHALDENNESSATHHVAEMVAYLGHPPVQYLCRNQLTKNVFNEDGSWKGAGGVGISQQTLDAAERYLDGDDKKRFLAFMRSMLRWLPEDRKCANELMNDPWLRDTSS